MANSPNKGLKRILQAAVYSWQGMAAAYRYEEAFRQETWLAVMLIPVGLWLGESGVEKALLVGTTLLVLLVEILNSALEAVVDRFGGDLHDLSGRAKDMGSAAVFIAIVILVVVWMLVLFVP